jgi:DNA polymerase-3 subunit gamma/tau
MSYQVLARKWRPQTFAEIVGQEHVTTTLANALARGRVAHAYLFTGPRGCGKTTMARLLAKALNCDEGLSAEPCGKCGSCTGIANGTYLDVLEIDAASNTGVDNVRELRENAQYQPTAGKKRVFIIDEVHMLSKGAFNALLKILEEPPAHVHFVFATTEPARIPRTILSRCQRFDFRLFTLDELLRRLRDIIGSERIEITEEAIELLASLAEGSMRDALSLLDQAISSSDGKLDRDAVLALYGLVGPELYLDLNEAILERNTAKALDLVEGLVGGGHDLVEFARGIVGNFRDLLLLCLDPGLSSRVEKPEAIKRSLLAQAPRFDRADLLHLTQRAAEHYLALERAPQPRWLLEAQLVEYTTFESRVLLSEILGRLEGHGTGANPQEGGPQTKRTVSPTKRASRASSESAGARSKAKPMSPPNDGPENYASNSPGSSPPASAEGRSASTEGARNASGELSAQLSGEFREAYSRFVAGVRERQIALGTCLMQAAPRLEGEELSLVFHPEHGFHRDQVAEVKALGLLHEVAHECFGRKIRVQPITETPEQSEEELRRSVQEQVAPSQQQELERRARANPHLGRLLEGLGGKVEEA